MPPWPGGGGGRMEPDGEHVGLTALCSSFRLLQLAVWRRGTAGPSFMLLSDFTIKTAPSRPHKPKLHSSAILAYTKLQCQYSLRATMRIQPLSVWLVIMLTYLSHLGFVFFTMMLLLIANPLTVGLIKEENVTILSLVYKMAQKKSPKSLSQFTKGQWGPWKTAASLP